MALNLSTLTSSATSGDVLQEATTTADFLENVPVLRNVARGSNKGGDAKQSVSLNQPKALPLDANGKGYCYLPVTTGNAPAVTFPTIGASDDFVLEMVAYIVDVENFHVVSGSNYQRLLIFNSSGSPSFRYRDSSNNNSAALSGSLSAGLSTLRFEKTGSTLVFKQNGAVKGTINNITAAPTFTHLSFNGQFATSHLPLNGYIQTTTLSINGTEQLNVDFTATNVRHGDTKFKCATGQVVTINQSGNDPATIIKKPVLRFDGTNDGLNGLFANNINGGYMFAAFSVLGDGGLAWGRVFTTNLVGSGVDYIGAGAGFSLRNSNTTGLVTIVQGLTQAQTGMFDDANGDILHEVKLKGSDFSSKVNNAGFLSATHSNTIDSNRFNIGQDFITTQNAAIDLEYLALFDASITDAQADSVRNYINNRNNVFDLKDGFGYYFYDAQNAPVGAISSGSSAWSGRIVGSDNGDSASIEATQATANHQPVSDGFKVTFADNTDHLDIPSTSQAGWQVVGTSLGTFAYRVNANAQVRLNLLGYRGSASSRKAGDLYGIILLPESATGKDIQEARKLLIDRGASESVTGSSAESFWISRSDIVEFSSVDFTGVSNVRFGWNTCSAMTKFNVGSLPDATNVYNAFRSSGLTSFNTDLPLAIRVDFAWRSCASLTSFGAVDIKNCTNFTSSWQDCSALTSFPAGAKLGTSASNVNFSSAWRSSGLTGFPDLDLSTGTNFSQCWRQSALVNFPALDLSNGTTFLSSWYGCSSMVEFSLVQVDNATTFEYAWGDNSSLTIFPANFFNDWNPSLIVTKVFHNTWDGCTSLTAQSVENILTSIDASGKYATSTGASGGTALADAGIDIDYNVATGSLSAATNSAVTSLKAKGWSIIVNNVTL